MTLIDFFLNENECSNVELMQDSQEKLKQSVLKNLSDILNTRQGSLQHLPDYGVPDISSFYQGLPCSVQIMVAAIKTAIRLYEPRLTNFQLLEQVTEKKDHIINLHFNAQLIMGGDIKIQMLFSPNERVKVNPFTK